MKHRWSRVGKFLVHSVTSKNLANPAKPALVLVHGLGVSGRYLVPTGRQLAEQYRVFIPDLPGFGQSEKPWPALSLDELVQVLVDWMDTQELTQAHFYANSLGCQLAARLAARYPARVQSLVLGGPTVDRQARHWWNQLFRLALDIPRESPGLLLTVFWDYLVCGPPRIIATGLYALDDRLEDWLPGISCPVLVVRGEFDPIAPQRWAEEVAARLPRGRLAVLTNAAHAINYAAPVRLAALIQGLIEQTGDI